ncbi:hypothetical protein ACLOJK_038931 [Asimina triloba]
MSDLRVGYLPDRPTRNLHALKVKARAPSSPALSIAFDFERNLSAAICRLPSVGACDRSLLAAAAIIIPVPVPASRPCVPASSSPISFPFVVCLRPSPSRPFLFALVIYRRFSPLRRLLPQRRSSHPSSDFPLIFLSSSDLFDFAGNCTSTAFPVPVLVLVAGFALSSLQALSSHPYLACCYYY